MSFQIRELTIESLAAGGDAVARDEGRAVFVRGALPGDRVRLRVDFGRQPASAELLELVEPSTERVPSPCPHSSVCGGCQWIELSYQAQLVEKQKLFFAALEHIGGIERGAIEAHSLVPSPSPLRYRHRARLHVQGKRLGFSARRSHALAAVGSCALLTPKLSELLPTLAQALAEAAEVPGLRDISIAHGSGRVAVALHLSGKAGAKARALAETLLRGKRVKGVVLAAEGKPAELLGEPVLRFAAPAAEGLALYGRPDLFAQANPEANELLVRRALEWLGPTKEILELFSGAGNLTLPLARRGASVSAVELSGPALGLCRKALETARLQGVRLIEGHAEKVVSGLLDEKLHFDAVLLDPPRTGAHGLMKKLAKLEAPRIIYVSCDPSTLARDARELREAGYALKAVQPFDFFPQTYHVEGVALFERGG